MTRVQFTRFPIYEYLGCFPVLAIIVKLLIIVNVSLREHRLSFLLSEYLGLESLCHRVVLKETAIPFPLYGVLDFSLYFGCVERYKLFL